jgi:hypothetical protein
MSERKGLFLTQNWDTQTNGGYASVENARFSPIRDIFFPFSFPLLPFLFVSSPFSFWQTFVHGTHMAFEIQEFYASSSTIRTAVKSVRRDMQHIF